MYFCCRTVNLINVKSIYSGYISVTVNGIAIIFCIQLPKDLGNTFPEYFCKKYIFYCSYISVTINGIAFIFYIQLPKDLGNTFPGWKFFGALILQF